MLCSQQNAEKAEKVLFEIAIKSEYTLSGTSYLNE